MTEAMREKILRIGVIQGGKIIEEKLIRRRASVSVGTSTRNTIMLPVANAPKSFSLFELRGNEYHLTFTDEMTGRISVGNDASDLQSLKAQNLVRKSGSVYTLKLNEASRGRVSVGECILLFQFVSPPPEPVRPQLPAVVRGYWSHNIDWAYTTTFSLTVACFLAITIWAHTIPVPRELGIEDIPDRFAELLPDRNVEEDTKDNGAGEKKEAEKPKPQPKEDQNKNQAPADDQGDTAEAKAAKAAAHRADIEKKVAGRGLLKLLGAKGPGGMPVGTAVADVFGEGSVGNSENAFEGIGGVDVATAAGQRGVRGSGGATSAASIEDMGTRGVVGAAGQGNRQKTEAKVVANVTSTALQEFDSDSRSQQDIVNVVRRRLGGIKHCYESRLKRNPELKGKVVVHFVVHSGGTVIESSVVENSTGDSELGACIASQVRAIRFPPAQGGGETSVTYPFILAPGS
jgi:TonB family protein